MPEKIIARDHDHLVLLIEEAIEEKGPKCDLNFIDVSQVTDMHDLFADRGFRGNISEWDVSNVKDMEDMFYGSALETSGKIPAWYKESCS